MDTRNEIYNCIIRKQSTITEIVDSLQVSRNTVVHHIKTLMKYGMIKRDRIRRGNEYAYSEA